MDITLVFLSGIYFKKGYPSASYTNLECENVFKKSTMALIFSTSRFLFEHSLIPEGVLGGVNKRESQK